ncbi:hypothetical protein NB640_08905 [Oxalobacter vibrioformis]|uniref:Uncharacterized protein n=1 Tax=Oxalobacter vibrioformis TaxID=933080 RepID=A0A9E9LXN2_9BURK|nr:hypothetical protein [Oxalobacter vibrioformis]WAW09367.1 hypothetical protein NB640_08905 [Oxalobacter vibrioformis]
MNHKPCYLPNMVMDETLFSAFVPLQNEDRLISLGFCNRIVFNEVAVENQKSDNVIRLIEALTRRH